MAEQTARNSERNRVTEEIEIRRLLLAVWRGKWLIAITTCIGFILGGYYAFSFAKVIYSASATVLQEVDQEPVVDFSTALTGGGFGGGADQSSINTEIEVIKSRGLLELLVARLDLLSDPEFNVELSEAPTFSVDKSIDLLMKLIGISIEPDPVLSEQQILDAVVERLLDDLGVSNIRQTYVFEISIETSNAEKSAKIVNTLADIYIDNQLNIKSRANSRDIDWLTDRVKDLQSELEFAEIAVKDFNAATDLINEDTLAALNRQIKELRDRLDEEKDREQILATQIRDITVASPDRENMANATLNREILELFQQQRISTIKDWAEFDQVLQNFVDRAELELVRLRLQIPALEASIIRQEHAADQQSSDLLRLQQLQREATASGLLYEFFLSRLKETSVQSGIQEPESRILSHAMVAVNPSAPRRMLILATSLLFGWLAGLLAIVFNEMRVSTFRAAEILERQTQHPVVGHLPKVSRWRIANYLHSSSKKSHPGFDAALRNLRATVLLSDPVKSPQVILITSSVAGEGKTTLSGFFAQSLAGTGKSVLLLESNLRKPILSKHLTFEPHEILTSIEKENVEHDDLIHKDVIPNVDVVFSANSDVEPADFLSGRHFVEFVEAMKTQYDYIILDGPAVLQDSDAGILARIADVALYLVKWDGTPRADVLSGLKIFNTFAPIQPKMVLTQVNFKKQRRYGIPNS